MMKRLKDTLRLLGAAAFVGVASFGAYSMTERAVEEEGRKSCESVEVSVFFGSGGTELNGFARRQLDNVMAQIKKCKLEEIEVFGYSDASGGEDLNMKISQERAEAAYDYVAEFGLKADKVTIEAKGELGAIDAQGNPVLMRRKADLRFVPVPSDAAQKSGSAAGH